MNEYGYDFFGYDAEGYSREGYNRRGYGRDGFSREGYNAKGFDRNGFARPRGGDELGVNEKCKYPNGHTAPWYRAKDYRGLGLDKFSGPQVRGESETPGVGRRRATGSKV